MDDIAGIIVNLGAPDAPNAEMAEKFLREFLADARVLSVPAIMRIPLSRRIARKRAAAYARNLSELFCGGVHPMKSATEKLAKKTRQLCPFPVFAAYRYGSQSIAETVAKLKERGVKKFAFAPMYPQKTQSTSLSAEDEIARAARGCKYAVAPEYFDAPAYIAAASDGIPAGCETLVVSFHSVPLSHDRRGEYAAQCAETARLIAEKSGAKNFSIAYQSKMGRGKWLAPEIKDEVRRLAECGHSDISVVAASFACDCAETLLELGRDVRNAFSECGGKNFNLIPCPNDSPEHARLTAERLIKTASQL